MDSGIGPDPRSERAMRVAGGRDTVRPGPTAASGSSPRSGMPTDGLVWPVGYPGDDARDRRHPDLPLVVPAEPPRPAPHRPLDGVRRVRSFATRVSARPAVVLSAIVVVSAAVAAWFTTQMVLFEPDE